MFFVAIGRRLSIFSDVAFKMAAWWPYWNLQCFRSITQVCFRISILNFICLIFMAMGRSLLIFSDISFKMATWRPYWIFWFLQRNSSNSEFQFQFCYACCLCQLYDDRQTEMGFAGYGCCGDWHWRWRGYTQTRGGLGILVGPVQYGVED